MHCDPTKWPTEAAELLIKAFPQLASETNNTKLTADQIFHKGIDSEELETKPAEEIKKQNKGAQKRNKRQEDTKTDEEYKAQAAAARAGTIFNTRHETWILTSHFIL